MNDEFTFAPNPFSHLRPPNSNLNYSRQSVKSEDIEMEFEPSPILQPNVSSGGIDLCT